MPNSEVFIWLKFGFVSLYKSSKTTGTVMKKMWEPWILNLVQNALSHTYFQTFVDHITKLSTVLFSAIVSIVFFCFVLMLKFVVTFKSSKFRTFIKKLPPPWFEYQHCNRGSLRSIHSQHMENVCRSTLSSVMALFAYIYLSRMWPFESGFGCIRKMGKGITDWDIPFSCTFFSSSKS